MMMQVVVMMKIYEFDQNSNPGMYSAANDTLTKRKIEDTRKDKLTLADLNRLKKLRAFRRLEDLKRQDLLSVIYGQPEEDDGGMGL